MNTVIIDTTIDNPICQKGGSEGSLTGMTTGAVNGNIDDHTERLLLGEVTAEMAIYMETISGKVAIIVRDCASCISSPTADPIAAKSAAYVKYPIKK